MVKHLLWAAVAACFLVLVAVIMPTNAGAAGFAGATVTISVDSPAFPADQPVLVHVTLTNPTNRPLKLLKWYTLADDLEGPLFAVKRDGQPVAYLGPLFKRPAPTDKDYLHLQPGESVTHDVDIALYYDCSLSGYYRIVFEAASPQLHDAKGAGRAPERLVSNELTVWVDGRAAELAPAEAPKKGGGGGTYSQCTTAQQAAIVAARDQAAGYAGNALNYLLGGNAGLRYTTWFGVYDGSRYGTATSHFTGIDSALATAPLSYDCSCKKPYYAYVYPNQPYRIYLCRVFWTAPTAGTDSKAGTLIHEISHFTVVAGTDDYVYGQTNAKALAISDPDKAVNNADNHEYFAENTPAQP